MIITATLQIALRSVIGMTISLAKTVEGAGVMFIARTASADHYQTGAVG